MYCTFPLVRSLFFGSCLLSISSPKNITRKPSLTLPLFIKVSVSSQESEQSRICGLSSGILGLLLFWFFLFGGGGGGSVMGLTPLSTIFQLYRAIGFIGGGNRRKPTTCRKSPTNFIVVSSTSRLSGIRAHNASDDRH